MQNIARALGFYGKHDISTDGGWKKDDFINLLLLSFVYGCYFLLLTIAMYLAGGISETEETIIFVQGWFSIPVLSLLALVAIQTYKTHWNDNDVFFYPVFLCLNYAICLLSGIGFRLCWLLWPSILPLLRAVIIALVLFPLIQVYLIWALRKYRASLAGRISEKWIPSLYGLLPLIVSVFIAIFSNNNVLLVIPTVMIIFAIVFGHSGMFNFVFSKFPGRWTAWLIDISAILIIICACFDPKFTINVYNQNYYLGPVNALLHGRTILVNVFSQYGVLVLEFLALIFKLKLLPFSYQGMSFLVALLSMLQYVVIYFLLRTILKSPPFSFLALLVILLVNFFATDGVFQATPSIGPLRFGLCYLILALCVLYFKYPAKNRVIAFLAYILLGLASLWSFETFVYVAFMFLGMLVYQSVVTNGREVWKVLKSILYGSLLALLSIGICHAASAGLIFLSTSEWPKWGYYFAFIFLFEGGFDAMLVEPWSPWFFITAIYFLCLSTYAIKWLVEKKLESGVENAAILCLCFFGIAQFTYFLNRSHPNNLFHISVPAIIIGFYGINQIGKLASQQFLLFRKIAIIGFIFTMAILCSLCIRQSVHKFSNTGFGFLRTLVDDQLSNKVSIGKVIVDEYKSLWVSRPSTQVSADAVYLIRKYAGDKTSVTVFLSNDSTTESLLLSNKIHTYLINHPLEDDLNAQVSRFIFNHPPKLQIGDMVFLASDPSQLRMNDENILKFSGSVQYEQYREFQQQLVLLICEQFSFEKVEATSHGVTAFRLAPFGNKPSDYCIRLKALK
jgi:hypothetical protein